MAYLKAKDFARKYKLSYATVLKLINTNQLSHIKLGNSFRINEDDIKKLEVKNVGTTSKKTSCT